MVDRSNPTLGALYSHPNGLFRPLRCLGLCKLSPRLSTFKARHYPLSSLHKHIDILITPFPNSSEIADAGKEWSMTHWRTEDMVAYVFRLYLEWGRLVADQRGTMDFVWEEGMETSKE